VISDQCLDDETEDLPEMKRNAEVAEGSAEEMEKKCRVICDQNGAERHGRQRSGARRDPPEGGVKSVPGRWIGLSKEGTKRGGAEEKEVPSDQ